ncbi:MAG: hypothetical protein QXE27_07195 [Thermoplasmata archaeon]
MLRNRKGALEGLPLYLLIMVIIIALGTGIIWGYLQYFNKPNLKTLVVEPKQIPNNIQSTIEFWAYDNKNSPLQDVVIELKGVNVINADKITRTDAKGYAKVTITPVIDGYEDSGSIRVTATYTGGTAPQELHETIVVVR